MLQIKPYGKISLFRKIIKNIKILNRDGYILVNCSKGLIKEFRKSGLLN